MMKKLKSFKFTKSILIGTLCAIFAVTGVTAAVVTYENLNKNILATVTINAIAATPTNVYDASGAVVTNLDFGSYNVTQSSVSKTLYFKGDQIEPTSVRANIVFATPVAPFASSVLVGTAPDGTGMYPITITIGTFSGGATAITTSFSIAITGTGITR